MRPEMQRIALPENQLRTGGERDDLAGRAYTLLRLQKDSWDLCRTGYGGLSAVRVRSFFSGSNEVRIQWNPGRIASTAARVDEASLRSRPCFLCPGNLPEPQRGILYRDSWLVLCNPYPIFPEHFTITHLSHIPQRISSSVDVLLALARDMGRRYAVFYNGPRCGASAPDHMHFQAGTRGFLPLEQAYRVLAGESGEEVFAEGKARVTCVSGGHRPFVLLEGDGEEILRGLFDRVTRALHGLVPSDEEPMMNVIVFFETGTWRVIVIPRVRHRPSFFSADGEDRLLLSPAAVDLGGVCVVPLEKDFHRITAAHLETMFGEVCLTGNGFGRLAERLRSTRGLPHG